MTDQPKIATTDRFPDDDRYLAIESITNGYLVTGAFQVKQPTPPSTTAVHRIPTDNWQRELLKFTFCEAKEMLVFVDGYLQPKGRP